MDGLTSIWSSVLNSRFYGLPDRPVKSEAGQTPFPNVFVTGNLAGTPNIKASMNDGYAVGLNIAENFKQSPYRLRAEVGIVGGGPAGIGVAMALHHHNISFVIWEQGEFCQTIDAFTTNKIIYSSPNAWTLPENLWFEDANKETLLENWQSALLHIRQHIQTRHHVADIRKYKDIFNVYVTNDQAESKKEPVAVIVLATGTQLTPKKLGVPGEERPSIQHIFYKPSDYKGQRVTIVGGGSTAIEATLELLKQGNHCKLVHRGQTFSKANKERLSELEKWKSTPQLEIHMESTVKEFKAFSNSDTQMVTTIESAQNKSPVHLIGERVLVLIGGTPHSALLEQIGLKMESDNHFKLSWIPFMVLVYCFYLLKSGVEKICPTPNCVEPILQAKQHFFPLTLSWLSSLPNILTVDLGFRVVNGSFWGTLAYSATIVVFGIKAIRKYKSNVQRNRYLSLMIFQVVFLFGIPEVIAPWLISLGHGMDFFGGDRPWKLYGLFIPWPLSIHSLIDGPSYMHHPNSSSIALVWMTFGAIISFVVIPLYVKYQGQRFCSYLCGCGGLAETLGDAFRDLAPKGPIAKKLEQMGRWIWIIATIVTLLIVNDAWQLVSTAALSNAKLFAEKWYALMVDFWLASIVGVAFYPVLGNRVWCRFACPLRAYMETIAKYTTKLSIESKDTCIGCYECTRQCQMGIPVHEFALREHSLNNQNSACIQCGICIEVCPLDVLHVQTEGDPIIFKVESVLSPPMKQWK